MSISGCLFIIKDIKIKLLGYQHINQFLSGHFVHFGCHAKAEIFRGILY